MEFGEDDDETGDDEDVVQLIEDDEKAGRS